MSNSMIVTFKYIGGRLFVMKGETSCSCVGISLNGSYYSLVISTLACHECVNALGATRKYLASSREYLLDGVVSQEQYAAILESIENALCFYHLVSWKRLDIHNTPFVLIPVVDIMSGDCEKIIVLSVVGNSEDDCVASLHDVIPYYDSLRTEVCELTPNEWRVTFYKPKKKRDPSEMVIRYRQAGAPASEAVIKNLRLVASFEGNLYCTYFDSMGGRFRLYSYPVLFDWGETQCEVSLRFGEEAVFTYEGGDEKRKVNIYYHTKNGRIYAAMTGV